MKSIFLKYTKAGSSVLALLLILTATSFAQDSTTEFTVNGLKVILRKTQKETLSMSMYFKGGSANHAAANAGIELLALSGAVECGTSKYAADEFNDQRDEYGLHLSGDATNDYGIIKLRCISRYTDDAWKLFSSAIAAPVFQTQKFNLLKEQKINELKEGLAGPDARLKHLARQFAFSTTPYAINPDGTVESLMGLSRETVKNYYYNTLLNKNRMFLVVAGNISREDLEKKIQSAFSEIPTKKYTPVNIESPLFAREAATIESRPLATNYLCGILNAPDLNNPDYPAYRLAITILHSALFDVIRLSKHLSYAPYATLSEGKITYAMMYASTTQPAETVKAMRSIVAYIKNVIYSEEFMETVRKSQLLSYLKQQEKMSDIVDELGDSEIMGDWKLAENLGARMRTVTAAEMKAVLNRYVKNITWAYIGDPSLGKQSFEK